METHNYISTNIVSTRLLALAFFIFAFFNAFGQTTVYLDPSSSQTTEDGSITYPYKSFDNSNLIFTSGYTYAVKRGTTMNVTRSIFVRPSNVTIRAYGSGARPVISSSVPETGKILDVSLSPNFTIRDIELKAVTRALTVINIQGAPNTKIVNCKLHEAVYGLRNIASSNVIYVDSVEIYNIQEDGIYFNGADSVIIKNSYIHHVNQAYFVDPTEQGSYGDAIQLDAENYFYVANNILDRSDTGNKFCFITGSNAVPGSVFEYNKCYGSPNLGAHLYLINTRGLIIRNNLFQGGPRSIAGTASNTKVYYNIFNNVTDGVFRQTTQTRQDFNNNVFANCNIIFSSWNDTLYVRNNIFYNVSKPYENNYLTESNNLYYQIGSALPPLSPSSIVANPNFVNADAGNFKLNANSPALKKGINLGYRVDYEGTSLPQTGNYDMGAYYQPGLGDTQAPTIPTALTSSNITETSFTLTWTASTDNIGVSGYDVYRNGTLFTSVGTTSASITGLTGGTVYAMTVRAKDAAGNISGISSTLNVTTLAGQTLPNPWSTQNIGNVGLPGSVTYNGNAKFTVSGSGADIWGSADGFRFVYQPLQGDGELRAYISSQSNSDGWAKSGLMIRQTLSAGSANAMISVSPSRGMCFQSRTTNGGSTTTTVVGGIAAPVWLRITRTGNVITGYRSTNGTSWTQVGTVTINMGSEVYIGLNVCAHTNGAICTTVFDQISPFSTDMQAPSAPTVFTSNNITHSACTLTWNASTDNFGVTGYNIYQNTALLTTVTGTSANISGLSSGTTYNFSVMARDAAGNYSSATGLTLTTLSACAGGPVPWTNTSFTNQTGSFTAEFDIVPGGGMMSGLVGLSNYAAGSFGSLACIVRFNDITGTVDVRNGSAYTATNSFPYSGSVAYHIRMSVNITNHTYDVYIRQIGGSEVLIASQYAFRTEQANITQLNNWSLQTDKNCLAVSNFSINGLKSTKENIAEVTKVDQLYVKVYPNPASEMVNVEVLSPATVRVLGMNGKMVLEQPALAGNNIIPLNLKSGIYLMQVIGEKGKVSVQKFIVK